MSKFKVGDLAWSPSFGFGTITQHPYSSKYQLAHGHLYYTPDGFFNMDDKFASLFTVEEAAKLGHYPPKKKVTKTIEIWRNIYHHDDVIRYDDHVTNEAADNNALRNRTACVKLTGTYEVEE